MSSVIYISHVPRLLKKHRQAISWIVRATALRGEAETKFRIIAQDLVDTGFMLNSVHVRVVDEFTVEIIVAAEYAVYHELGTTRTPARPFLTPAIDSLRAEFKRQLKAALGK